MEWEVTMVSEVSQINIASHCIWNIDQKEREKEE
jgi:hypothetical protein